MKYKAELTNLILNTKELEILLDKARAIIEVINQSDDFALIKQELTQVENYVILKQVACISNYLEELGQCVVMGFIDYVLGKNADQSDREITGLEKKLAAIRLMHSLYQTNEDLFAQFSQPKTKDCDATFELIFGPKKALINDRVTYQFLFDSQTKTWQLKRLLPGEVSGEVVQDWPEFPQKVVLDKMRPETLNPFIKKSLFVFLQDYENNLQGKQYKEKIEGIFKSHWEEFSGKIQSDCNSIFLDLALFNKIRIIDTNYFRNAKKKPDLMAELLAVDGLFELVDKCQLISRLSKYIEWNKLEKLLEKESIKQSILKADLFDLDYLQKSSRNLKELSKFYFKNVKKLKLGGKVLYEWVLALSEEDFIRYRNQRKIQLDYPPRPYEIEKLYKAYPSEFQGILEAMINSGKLINELPGDEEILSYYVNLLFKHKGQWFNLIKDYQESGFNYKAMLLSCAMEADPQQTVSIIKGLAQEDCEGNQCLPVPLTVKEIAALIAQSSGHACVLLDYANILERLRQEVVSFKPYGTIRQFDHLNRILKFAPANYSEMLLGNGLLFPEKGMSYFLNFSSLYIFGSGVPSSCISDNFRKLYDQLPSSTFMKALAAGLVNNPNVNRLFLGDIPDISLLKLAEVLKRFQRIRHLELILSLEKKNQTKIIEFFKQMMQTNPGLHYHIQVGLSIDKDPFIFLKNYLSEYNPKIVTLTITPNDWRIKSKLLDGTDHEFKAFFNAWIEELCRNNSRVRKINIHGFSECTWKSESNPRYHFTQFPIDNTQLLEINEFGVTAKEKDETARLLGRNRKIYALRRLSTRVRHFQTSLELLPWLGGLPKEIIVNILDRSHPLSKKIPAYHHVLEAIKKTHELKQAMIDDAPMEHQLRVDLMVNYMELKTSFKVNSMEGYYRYKPHKKNINKLEQFLGMDELQKRTIKAITAWFLNRGSAEVSNMRDEFARSNGSIERSQSALIAELDGVSRKEPTPGSIEFCELRNLLHHYQKAITRSLKKLRRDAYVAFQCKGSLSNKLAWHDLSLQAFDGFELIRVLGKYNPDDDISADDWLEDQYAEVFTGFNDKEKTLFTAITLALKQYLQQKEKPRELQSDWQKHRYKNELFNLIRPENIIIFEKPKPRLYQILQAERERLAASISGCSTKLALRCYGLFSIAREEKKALDEPIISSFESEINQQLS